MLGKTYALAGRIVKPKTIPTVGVGVEKLMENWVSHAYLAGLFHSTTKTNQVKDLFYYRFCSAFGIDLFQAQTAVRCSDLVRRPKVYHSKISDLSATVGDAATRGT